jgi:hypothetical protein
VPPSLLDSFFDYLISVPVKVIGLGFCFPDVLAFLIKFLVRFASRMASKKAVRAILAWCVHGVLLVGSNIIIIICLVE